MKPTRNSVSPGDLVRISKLLPIPIEKMTEGMGPENWPALQYIGEGLLLDSYVNQCTNTVGAYFNFYEVLWNGNIRQLNGLDYSLTRIDDV